MLDRDRRLESARHESGHAVGAIALGYVFDSVQVGAYPCLRGLRREREPLEDPDPDPSDRDAMRRWIDAVELRDWREARDRAIVARCGALAAGTPWEAPGNRADRQVVYELTPVGVGLARWSRFVDDEARELAASAAFGWTQARVSRALAVDERLTYADVEALIA